MTPIPRIFIAFGLLWILILTVASCASQPSTPSEGVFAITVELVENGKTVDSSRAIIKEGDEAVVQSKAGEVDKGFKATISSIDKESVAVEIHTWKHETSHIPKAPSHEIRTRVIIPINNENVEIGSYKSTSGKKSTDAPTTVFVRVEKQ